MPSLLIIAVTLDELKAQLLTLTSAEKVEVVQLLVHSLSNAWPGVERTPGVVGGDACIIGTRIPVWDLVQYRSLGASDTTILEAYPQLTATDLAQAWHYADANAEEIERAISQNEAA